MIESIIKPIEESADSLEAGLANMISPDVGIENTMPEEVILGPPASMVCVPT